MGRRERRRHVTGGKASGVIVDSKSSTRRKEGSFASASHVSRCDARGARRGAPESAASRVGARRSMMPEREAEHPGGAKPAVERSERDGDPQRGIRVARARAGVGRHRSVSAGGARGISRHKAPRAAGPPFPASSFGHRRRGARARTTRRVRTGRAWDGRGRPSRRETAAALTQDRSMEEL